jgi:GMP synthase (glutamine-hydrolysing)
MSQAPFLFLGVRPEDAAADDEYEAMLRATGLERAMLHRVRVDRQPVADLDLDGYAGVILGGGPFCVSDPAEKKTALQRRVEDDLDAILDRVLAADIPFMGCCYGIGTLGRHVGATVDRTWGEDVAGVGITVTDDGANDPVFAGSSGGFSAFVGHKEAISELPPGAVLLASSATAPVQAFKVGRAYAIQFHPELDLAGLELRMRTYADHGYFAPEDLGSLLDGAARSGVDQMPSTLRRFVEVYGRPA